MGKKAIRKEGPKAKSKNASRVTARKRRAEKRPGSWCRDIWPQERDILYRPERLKYVRRAIAPKECVFCEAALESPRPSTLLLYRDQHVLVMLNKFPYNTGHLLVMPRRHCGDPLLLSEPEYLSVQKMVRYVLYVVREVYAADGVNVGLNLGKVAGAGIPEHLHYHLIPRWSGDTNFFPLIAETKVLVETLEQSYGRLIPYFNEGIRDLELGNTR